MLFATDLSNWQTFKMFNFESQHQEWFPDSPDRITGHNVQNQDQLLPLQSKLIQL